MVEHLYERPLCPLVIFRVAGLDFAAPVVAETDFVQLGAVAVNVLAGGDLRVLPGLYGILLGRQSVSVIAHRMENIETLQTLEAAVYVGSYVAQGMPDVKSRT